MSGEEEKKRRKRESRNGSFMIGMTTFKYNLNERKSKQCRKEVKKQTLKPLNKGER